MNRAERRRAQREVPKFRRCADCNAIAANGAYEHERGCPLFHQLEAVKMDDAAWLVAHPGQIRERNLTAPERVEFVMLNGREPETDQVGVARLGDNRVRFFKAKVGALNDLEN